MPNADEGNNHKEIPDSTEWNCVPLVSVGDLRFGMTAEEVRKIFKPSNEHWEHDKTVLIMEITNLDGYLNFHDEVLNSACLYDNAYFEGTNIIGLKLAEFEKALGTSHDSEDIPILFEDGTVMTHYDFGSSQVLIGIESGVITSVTFANYDL